MQQVGESKRVTRLVPLEDIIFDRIPKPTNSIVSMYASFMGAGITLNPIKLAKRKDGKYEIRDGRHRCAAAVLNGCTHILARYSERVLEVCRGEQEQALREHVKQVLDNVLVRGL